MLEAERWQVYRGTVTAPVVGHGTNTREVAVKIIHPGVQVARGAVR
jgi:predicted unusual protein kinase regulating ubiquinone biosynthesis (AarF/ABC1/UbiB family)